MAQCYGESSLKSFRVLASARLQLPLQTNLLLTHVLAAAFDSAFQPFSSASFFMPLVTAIAVVIVVVCFCSGHFDFHSLFAKTQLSDSSYRSVKLIAD